MTPRRRTSRSSATTGTSRSAPRRLLGTARPRRRRAGPQRRRAVRRRDDPARPGRRAAAAAPTYCCSTSRPTTSTCARGGSCTRPSTRRSAECWSWSATTASCWTGSTRSATCATGRSTWYGGNLAAYEEAVAVEQEAAERMLSAPPRPTCGGSSASWSRRRSRWPAPERHGQKMCDAEREPEDRRGRAASARRRCRRASTSGCTRSGSTQRTERARARPRRAVHDDDEIRVDLPKTAVPRGPDRAAPGRPASCAPALHGRRSRSAARSGSRSSGRNGAGKTHPAAHPHRRAATGGGHVDLLVPLRFLPQRLDLLRRGRCRVVDNLARLRARSTDNHDARAGWPGSSSAGARADQPVAAPCPAANASGPPLAALAARRAGHRSC